MDLQDGQREVRSVYVGGFWGQLVLRNLASIRGARHVGHRTDSIRFRLDWAFHCDPRRFHRLRAVIAFLVSRRHLTR